MAADFAVKLFKPVLPAIVRPRWYGRHQVKARAPLRADAIIDGYKDTVNDGFTLIKEALRALIILGFFRHGQEGLNKE